MGLDVGGEKQQLPPRRSGRTQHLGDFLYDHEAPFRSTRLLLQQCEQLGNLAIVLAIPDPVFRIVPGTSEQRRARYEDQRCSGRAAPTPHDRNEIPSVLCLVHHCAATIARPARGLEG